MLLKELGPLAPKSKIGIEANKINHEWLSTMDEHIRKNLPRLTCNNVMELYYSLFGELKRWRSTSHGFTGFSEFLIFRMLYHTIGEEFGQRPHTEPAKGTTPIIFTSKNYEVMQNVRIPLLGGKNSFPDIFVKRNGKPTAIIQVKIVMNRGKKQIDDEVKTLRLIKKKYPDIKVLLIVMIRDSFPQRNEKLLTEAGYEKVIVLQGNKAKMSDELRKAI